MARPSSELSRLTGRPFRGAARWRMLAWLALPALALGCKAGNGSNVTPTITSFSPTSADPTQATSSSPITITVTGSGFYNGGTNPAVANVTLSGIAVPHGSAYADNQVVSDTELTFDLYGLPSTLTTSGPIQVTTTGGTATSAENFNVVPILTSVSPASGGAGTPLTVAGNGLLAVTGITFAINGDTQAGTITAQTATQLTVTVPTLSTNGTVTITFQNPITALTSSSFSYTGA